jgi:hypothetical protein
MVRLSLMSFFKISGIIVHLTVRHGEVFELHVSLSPIASELTKIENHIFYHSNQVHKECTNQVDV